MLLVSLPPTEISSPEQSGFHEFARILEIRRWRNQNNNLSEQGYKMRKDVAKGEQYNKEVRFVIRIVLIWQHHLNISDDTAGLRTGSRGKIQL